MSMEIDEMIAVLQAAKAGKQIQFKIGANWMDLMNSGWDFESYSYRVKPEPPKPRTFCVKFEGDRIYGHLAADNGAATGPHPDCFFVREVLDAPSDPSA